MRSRVGSWPAWLGVVGCLLVALVARAESVTPPAPVAGPPAEPQIDDDDAADTPAAGAAPRRWSAAVGALVSVGPEFAGASRIDSRLQPGLALRWGRVSLASRSAFAVRGEGASAQGGLRVELVRGGRWRSSLGLRWDSGRDQDSSAQLAGLGDVRGTLRARVSLGYRLDGGWRAGATWTTDLLGRGGGWQGEVNAGHDQRLTPHTALGAGVTLGVGGRRWLQNHFGITPEQSARSGYVVYTPDAGLRDVTLSLGARTELGSGWAVFYGASASRLLGPAAASPLVRERNGWGFSAGVVKRL